jgi:hypothetical protein
MWEGKIEIERWAFPGILQNIKEHGSALSPKSYKIFIKCIGAGSVDVVY